MPKDNRPLYEKHGDKLRFLVLISFALIVALQCSQEHLGQLRYLQDSFVHFPFV